MTTKRLDWEEQIEREYTLREIRMIMDRQRELRWKWYQEKLHARLPMAAIVCLAVAALALAVLLGMA